MEAKLVEENGLPMYSVELEDSDATYEYLYTLPDTVWKAGQSQDGKIEIIFETEFLAHQAIAHFTPESAA